MSTNDLLNSSSSTPLKVLATLSNTTLIYELTSTITKIGRSLHENHILLNSQSISKEHCIITFDNKIASIVDLNSKNGTFVNSVRIVESTTLNNNDFIRIGYDIESYKFTYTNPPQSVEIVPIEKPTPTFVPLSKKELLQSQNHKHKSYSITDNNTNIWSSELRNNGGTNINTRPSTANKTNRVNSSNNEKRPKTANREQFSPKNILNTFKKKNIDEDIMIYENKKENLLDKNDKIDNLDDADDLYNDNNISNNNNFHNSTKLNSAHSVKYLSRDINNDFKNGNSNFEEEVNIESLDENLNSSKKKPFVPILDLPINQNPEIKHSAKFNTIDNLTNRTSASAYSSYRSATYNDIHDENNLLNNEIDEINNHSNESAKPLNKFTTKQSARFNLANEFSSEEQIPHNSTLPISSRLKLSSRQGTFRSKSQNFSILQTIPDINSPVNRSSENVIPLISTKRSVRNLDEASKSNRNAESLIEVTNNSALSAKNTDRNPIDHLEAKFKSITNEILDDKKERTHKISESLRPLSLNPNPEPRSNKADVIKSSRVQNKHVPLSTRFSNTLESHEDDKDVKRDKFPSNLNSRVDKKENSNNSYELESIKKHAAKLQSLVKDLQRNLAEKNLHIQTISNIDGVNDVLKYQIQIEQLNSTLNCVEDEKNRYIQLFADLEKRVLSYSNVPDSQCEIVQFLQDQSRQIMIVKRANLEMQRRQKSSFHNWTKLQNENKKLEDKVASLERKLAQQKQSFTASMREKDIACYESNRILSEISAQSGIYENNDVEKQVAAQYLLSNLERYIQNEQYLKNQLMDLEHELYESRELNANKFESSDNDSELIDELRDTIEEMNSEQNLKRINELESTIDSLYENIHIMERKSNLLSNQLHEIKTEDKYNYSDIYQELSEELQIYKSKEADLIEKLSRGTVPVNDILNGSTTLQLQSFTPNPSKFLSNSTGIFPTQIELTNPAFSIPDDDNDNYYA